MRLIPAIVAALTIVVALPVDAQMKEADLRDLVRAAGKDDPAPSDLLGAANASRLLREFDAADEYYTQAMGETLDMLNALISSSLLQELASGRGVDGIQRKFREIRDTIPLPPLIVVGHISNYPSLLTGGELDELVLGLSMDAQDPVRRCTCYLQKGWVHRVAGRPDMARMYFDSATIQAAAAPPAQNPDAAAHRHAQYARDLARAGRTDEARRVLAEAMAMPLTDQALPTVRRRWAQAYAELGDVANAVAQIEPLLDVPSLVTVHTLETRLTWEPIRNDPAFQAMLDRHR
jgi:tetratricopeptide (TPR) repeat protein